MVIVNLYYRVLICCMLYKNMLLGLAHEILLTPYTRPGDWTRWWQTLACGPHLLMPIPFWTVQAALMLEWQKWVVGTETVVIVQLLSCVWLFETPWTTAHQASLSSNISRSLQKLVSIELMMPFTVLSSISPFSSCLQSFPASGSFPMIWLFTSGQEW